MPHSVVEGSPDRSLLSRFILHQLADSLLETLNVLCSLSYDASRVLMLPGDRPYEAEQFPRDGGADLVLGHPSRAQTTIPSRKAFLRLPGDGLYGRSGLFGASLHGRRLSGGEPITPGGFDKHAPHVGVARLGNRAPLLAVAAGMLAGHQTHKGHQLARRVKAGEVSQFSQGRDGGERVHAAQGHYTACLTLPRPVPQRLLQRLVQPFDPCLGFLDRVHLFLKDDLLRRLREALGLQPAKVRVCDLAEGVVRMCTDGPGSNGFVSHRACSVNPCSSPPRLSSFRIITFAERLGVNRPARM